MQNDAKTCVSAHAAMRCVAPRPSASTQQDKRGQPINVNAAVGAAVSNAGKVAGAVGSIAVAGAKQLLTGLIPKPPGKVREGVSPGGCGG